MEDWFREMRQRELDQFPIGTEVIVTLHGECPRGRKHGDRELGLRGMVLATDGGHHTNPDREGHPIWVTFRNGWSWFYAPGEIRQFDMLTDLNWTPEDALRWPQRRMGQTLSEHLIAVEQTHRASGGWQVRCTCGWTQPYTDTPETRQLIDEHLAAARADGREGE